MVFEDKYIIFYATDPIKKPKQEFWIITGAFPPSMVDATNTIDERDAIILFGEIFQHEGRVIQNNSDDALILPPFVISNKKDEKSLVNI